jgi:hypothetical protein
MSEDGKCVTVFYNDGDNTKCALERGHEGPCKYGPYMAYPMRRLVTGGRTVNAVVIHDPNSGLKQKCLKQFEDLLDQVLDGASGGEVVPQLNGFMVMCNSDNEPQRRMVDVRWTNHGWPLKEKKEMEKSETQN